MPRLLGGIWYVYSPLFYISPSEIRDHLDQLQAFDQTVLETRFRAKWPPRDDSEAQKLEDFVLGTISFYRDLVSLFQVAEQNKEAMLWYIA